MNTMTNSNVIKHERIITNDTLDMLMQYNKFPNHYPYSMLKNIDIINETNYNNFNYVHAIDGQLLKVYYFNRTWNITTNNTTNAINSKWSSEVMTFGIHFANFFKSILDDYLFEIDDILYPDADKNVDIFLQKLFSKKLNKNKIYFFFITAHKSEEIVPLKNHPKQIFLIKTYDIKTQTYNYNDVITINNYSITSQKFLKFKSYNEVITFFNNIDTTLYQGLLLYHKYDSTKPTIKILHPAYKYYYDLRNNISSIYAAYILNWKKFFFHKSITIKQLFNFVQKFKLVEFEKKFHIFLTNFTHYIHNIYIKKYIVKQNIFIPDDIKHIIYKLHSLYMLNKQSTTIEVVYKFLLFNVNLLYIYNNNNS
jgi:hypothetical protein